MAQFFAEDELVELTRRMFPLSREREDTFIAGLSMGGYGALKCGLRAPETFSKVASLSGGLDAPLLAKERTTKDNPYWTDIFGESAKGGFDDMRQGFLSGSDDYMVKPVNVNEMVLRVGALLRRAQMINERRQTIGSTVMECDSLTVTVGGESMVLPQKEFMLLYKMASFPGRIFTRQQLMDEIWGYDSESDTHTVDVHIGRLRERFRDGQDFRIVTMRGVGYKVVKA